MLKPIQSELLLSVPDLRHAFFTRQGGVSEAPFNSLNFTVKNGDKVENILENRRRAAEWFGVPETQLFMPHLVHEKTAITVELPFSREQRPKADAVVTVKENYILGVTSADCVSVLFVDPSSRVVAAAHAGWRGALKGIIESTIETMETQGAERHNILVAIGPAIQQQSYEVGQEVFNAFYEVSDDFKKFFEPANPGFYMFDLPGLVHERLHKAGVKAIDWIKMDTYTQPELFFSCRRNAHKGIKIFGDMMAGIMLKQ